MLTPRLYLMISWLNHNGFLQFSLGFHWRIFVVDVAVGFCGLCPLHWVGFPVLGLRCWAVFKHIWFMAYASWIRICQSAATGWGITAFQLTHMFVKGRNHWPVQRSWDSMCRHCECSKIYSLCWVWWLLFGYVSILCHRILQRFLQWLQLVSKNSHSDCDDKRLASMTWSAIVLPFLFPFGHFLNLCFPAFLLFCVFAFCFLLFCFSLLLCFDVSLLLCFSTFLLLCFISSSLLCFSTILLLCFLLFCFSAFPCFFASSLLEPKPTLKPTRSIPYRWMWKSVLFAVERFISMRESNWGKSVLFAFSLGFAWQLESGTFKSCSNFHGYTNGNYGI